MTPELSLHGLRKMLMAHLHHGNRYWSSSDPANMPCPLWTSSQQPSWHSTWPQYHMDRSGLLWGTGSSRLTGAHSSQATQQALTLLHHSLTSALYNQVTSSGLLSLQPKPLGQVKTITSWSLCSQKKSSDDWHHQFDSCSSEPWSEDSKLAT